MRIPKYTLQEKIKTNIGFKCIKVGEALQGDSTLLTTKSPGVSNTHFINLWNNQKVLTLA